MNLSCPISKILNAIYLKYKKKIQAKQCKTGEDKALTPWQAERHDATTKAEPSKVRSAEGRQDLLPS